MTVGEVVAQVHEARRFVRGLAGGRELSHLVFMGMGEPLHSYERTHDALRVLMDPHGQPISSKKITVSTVGLVPAMRRFSRDFEGRVQLALSLHAGSDETRAQIIPTARKWSLSALKEALLEHPLPNNRVLMIEYVVLPGVNDSDSELDGVADFTRGLRALVNLIPFNPFPQAHFRSPSPEEVRSVERRLKARGVPCSVRVTRGQEKSGACGQLAIQGF
jgi:23S rRNA (adenine2503-C2)-methyltransferase